MSNQNESGGFMKTLVGLVLGLCLLLVIGAAAFYAGTMFGNPSPQQVEVEVTREVIASGVEVQEAAASEPAVTENQSESETAAEQPPAVSESESEPEGESGSGIVEIEVTPVPEQEAAAAENSAPTTLSVDDLDLFLEVWSIIERDFDGELPTVEALNESATDLASFAFLGDETAFDVDSGAPNDSGPLAENLTAADLQPFVSAWDTIDDQVEGELPTTEQLNYLLIEGALLTLGDDYTVFVPPDVAARMREDMGGSFEGIGAFVRENEDGFVEIVRPMDGRPADLAGIEAGDLIIEVDGEDITGQSLDEVISKVRGPRDTEVVLGVQREGEADLLQISIIRARIEIPTVEFRMLENDIGYVTLTSFNQIATERLTAAVEELLAQGATSLIFDLRDNPGGFLDTAVDVADLFLEESVVLYERNARGLDQTFRADNGDLAEDIPLVVLVNAGSASASELVAGALRDNGRATIIGQLTFGKGSVQQLRLLSDGSELRVTIARWYTPADVNISKEGITPDIEVELPDDATLGDLETDTQLQRAIDYILEGN